MLKIDKSTFLTSCNTLQEYGGELLYIKQPKLWLKTDNTRLCDLELVKSDIINILDYGDSDNPFMFDYDEPTVYINVKIDEVQLSEVLALERDFQN